MNILIGIKCKKKLKGGKMTRTDKEVIYNRLKQIVRDFTPEIDCEESFLYEVDLITRILKDEIQTAEA